LESQGRRRKEQLLYQFIKDNKLQSIKKTFADNIPALIKQSISLTKRVENQVNSLFQRFKEELEKDPRQKQKIIEQSLGLAFTDHMMGLDKLNKKAKEIVRENSIIEIGNQLWSDFMQVFDGLFIDFINNQSSHQLEPSALMAEWNYYIGNIIKEKGFGGFFRNIY